MGARSADARVLIASNRGPVSFRLSDDGELSAMRDPRNWARPAAALVLGGSAGAALVLLRARRRAHDSSGDLDGMREIAERTIRDVGREARKLFGDR